MNSLQPCFSDKLIYACHGTPQSDTEYLLETMTAEGALLKPEAEIDLLVRSVKQPLILCGHSHMPFVYRTASGKTIVNPGSVGLPAYEEDLPVLHKMQNGSPHARFAIVYVHDAAITVELLAVSYDWNKAARLARSNNRPDWAKALESGRI